MSPAKKKTPAADMAPPPPRPPGPGVEDPALAEPTAPVAPPPPKPSQQGPATVTPTGAPTGAPPEAMVRALLAEIDKAGMAQRVTIQSFDWRSLPLVRAQAPSVPLVALYDATTWKKGSAWLGPVSS